MDYEVSNNNNKIQQMMTTTATVDVDANDNIIDNLPSHDEERDLLVSALHKVHAAEAHQHRLRVVTVMLVVLFEDSSQKSTFRPLNNSQRQSDEQARQTT